jgi:hypothetical protein
MRECQFRYRGSGNLPFGIVVPALLTPLRACSGMRYLAAALVWQRGAGHFRHQW